MKKALTLALILISISVNAQYSKVEDSEWRKPKLYVPALVLGNTFISNEFIPNLTYEQRTTIAISGCLTSAFLYILMDKLSEKHTKRKYKKYKRR